MLIVGVVLAVSAFLVLVPLKERISLANAERLAKEEAGRNEFGPALKRLNDFLPKVTDSDARRNIVQLHDEIFEQAQLYFFGERAKAEELMDRGKRDEAKEIYAAVLLALGDGNIEELSDYCMIAKEDLEALR